MTRKEWREYAAKIFPEVWMDNPNFAEMVEWVADLTYPQYVSCRDLLFKNQLRHADQEKFIEMVELTGFEYNRAVSFAINKKLYKLHLEKFEKAGTVRGLELAMQDNLRWFLTQGINLMGGSFGVNYEQGEEDLQKFSIEIKNAPLQVRDAPVPYNYKEGYMIISYKRLPDWVNSTAFENIGFRIGVTTVDELLMRGQTRPAGISWALMSV